MITFVELLNSPKLLSLGITAGKDGLKREIKAVSVMDSPSGYKWLKGGEFILTSAYLYADDPMMVEYVVERLIKCNCAGFGIKKTAICQKFRSVS